MADLETVHATIDHTGITGVGPAAFVGAHVNNSANQSITNNTDTVVAFDQEVFDSDAFHDPVTNNTRLTIPSGKDGYYLIGTTVAFASNATGIRRLQVYKNGVATAVAANTQGAVSGSETRLNASMLLSLVATDYLEVWALQNSGGALNLVGNTAYSARFWLTKVG
jgi:hypothetical protein